MPPITPQMLRDYLADALPEAELARIEQALRKSPELCAQLKQVKEQLDQGEHSLGAIWRRERISCPTRQELGSSLLGAADPEALAYIDFHLNVIGCPFCQANIDDLRENTPKKKKK